MDDLEINKILFARKRKESTCGVMAQKVEIMKVV